MPTRSCTAHLQTSTDDDSATRRPRARARRLLIAVCAAFVGVAALATDVHAIDAFPKSIRAQKMDVNGTVLYVRTGGSGPAVVMLHGFADTGDMWAPLAAALIADHTVIIPGYVSVISGELEDALGDGWRVLVGPQEASDINPFFRDVWGAVRAE